MDASLFPAAHATIIGAAGFIGRRLRERLTALGWTCNTPTRGELNFAPTADLGHVFFCAGLTADYAARPFATVEAHVTALSQTLQHAHFRSLVYLSSTRLYDSTLATTAVEDAPLVLAPLNPRHLYDLSKALGESLCHVAGSGRARVARLSCVYSDRHDPDGFLPGLLRQVDLARQSHKSGLVELELESAPHYVRDYVALNDVVDALVLIAVNGTRPIYNVASGINTTNAELIATLAELTDLRFRFLRSDCPRPPPVISISAMREDFGWHPVGVRARLIELLAKDSHAPH